MPKALVLIIFITLVISASAIADTTTKADQTVELKALTQQRFDANAANDRSFYERLLLPNFMLLEPFRAPQTKQEYLDNEFLARSTEPHGGKARITNFRALVDSNTAVATYWVIEPSIFGDQQFESYSMRVDSYVKIDTTWRLLSMAVTVPPTWPEVAVIDTLLFRDYVGTYELTPEIQIVISNESGHLMLEQTGLPKVELFPESQNSFFDKTDSPVARNRFARDASGKVVALLYRSGDQRLRIKKIK